MRVSKNIGIVLGLAIAGLGGTTSAIAQTSMQASAQMAAACEISAPTVALGDLAVIKLNTALNKEFLIDVKCSKGTPYLISDTQASGYRPMIGANTGISNTLNYTLYYQGSNGWWATFGPRTQGSTYSVASTGTGNLFQHRMRVDVVTVTMPTPDSYSASTTIELTF